MMFGDRKQLWNYCISIAKNSIPTENSLVLEFGVQKGESINYFADHWKDAKLVGFDSFQGLEEDWTGYELEKGHFDVKGVLPKVPKSVKLVCGWVQETLPIFLRTLQQNDMIRIIHLDLDTFSPTAFILNELRPFIVKNAIVIFDEYFGYPSWRKHEYGAWQEFVSHHRINYRYLGNTDMQVALIILQLIKTL